MYRVHLTEEQHQQLHQRAHQHNVAPRTRDRLEMVRLSALGWPIPKIAWHLGLHEHTVRSWIKAFLDGGFEALLDKPHTGKKSGITPEILAAVKEWLTTSNRTWNARQIAEEVNARYGVSRSLAQWHRLLHRERLSYKRTRRSLRHKQNAVAVSAKKDEIDTLNREADSGQVDVCHLDEAGFAMTLPPCYSWSPVGTRLSVPYEAPQGRRINAIGGYISHGPEAGTFEYAVYASLPACKSKKRRKSAEEVAASYGVSLEEVGAIDSARLVSFVWQLAGRPRVYAEDWKRARPLVVVLDNYSVHKSQTVQEAKTAWEAANISLLYLPSYCPELSDIEPIWQAVKHHEMQDRSQAEVKAMKQAVEQALAKKAEALRAGQAKTTNLLCEAA
jgi:putative transposase